AEAEAPSGGTLRAGCGAACTGEAAGAAGARAARGAANDVTVAGADCGVDSTYTVPATRNTNTAASDAAAARVTVYQRCKRTRLGGSATGSVRGPSAKSRGASSVGS